MDGPTLIDAVLGWSYLELRQRMSGGKGWINELPKIPTQFGSIEVMMVPSQGGMPQNQILGRGGAATPTRAACCRSMCACLSRCCWRSVRRS